MHYYIYSNLDYISTVCTKFFNLTELGLQCPILQRQYSVSFYTMLIGLKIDPPIRMTKSRIAENYAR